MLSLRTQVHFRMWTRLCGDIMIKDILVLVGGFLSSLLFSLSTIGITYSWFTEDSINAFIWVISAFVTLVVNLYAFIKIPM